MSEISHLLIKIGPSVGSASHIFWGYRVRHDPNYMARGLVKVSEELFIDLVVESGASEELQIRRGLRLG